MLRVCTYIISICSELSVFYFLCTICKAYIVRKFISLSGNFIINLRLNLLCKLCSI